MDLPQRVVLGDSQEASELSDALGRCAEKFSVHPLLS